MFPDHIMKDGIDFAAYDDGGYWFKPNKPGTEGKNNGNELLHARDRRAAKLGIADFGVGIIEDPNATRLEFRGVYGPRDEFGKSSYAWMVVESDLDRAHMPQPWARNLLPLLPVDRIWAWRNTPSPASRAIIEFNTPSEIDDAAMRMVETYLFLVIEAWKMGLRTQDAVRLLRNVGININGKQARQALDNLVSYGWIKVSHRVPPKGEPHGFWIETPRTRRYIVRHDSGSHPIHSIDGSIEERMAAYQSLFNAFVPFLKVPSLADYDTENKVLAEQRRAKQDAETRREAEATRQMISGRWREYDSW